MKHISFREGVRRWYRADRANIRYQVFIYSAAFVAALLYAFIFKTGIFGP